MIYKAFYTENSSISNKFLMYKKIVTCCYYCIFVSICAITKLLNNPISSIKI